MVRSDVGTKHMSISHSFGSDIDRMINQLDKKVRMGKKVHSIVNYIKANGLYSEKEMEFENLNMSRLKVNDRERAVLKNAWDIRHKINDKVLDDFEKLLELFNNDQ